MTAKFNMGESAKAAVAAVCALASFSALAWQMGTQGLVSFTYGGKLEFFCDKPVSVKELPGGKGWTSKVYEYATPDKKLGVRVTWKFYTDFDAAEYVPELYALGNDKTLPVSNLVSFDFSLDDGTKNKYAPKTVRVRSLVGDTCNIEMFTPQTRYLERNWVGYGALGRSSDGAREWPSFDSPSPDEMFFHKRYPWFWMTPGQQGNMPYLCFDFPEGDGLDIAIGWSGTWRCECLKLKSLFRARAGLGKTNFRVLPGETLRAPSIVMFHRPKGMTPREMRTIKHRFMLAMKSPRDSKGELIAPVMANTFYGGMWTDEMMTDFIKWTKKEELPFDAFWADAGWNGKNKLNPKSWDEWQDEIGTWTANPSVHPDGNFAKVADCAHAHDAKLMLWCEPERINTNTVFAALPPECLLSWEDERAKARKNIKVLNLGTEGGLNAAVGAVEDLIRDSHIDIYRQDSNTIYFNRYWDSGDVAEGPERVGVTEMKYIAGLYKFWDTLRERHPDLLIDNCASGGRRIDIELNSRSHVYCRSDYFINHRHEDQVIAAQNAVLNTLDIQPFQASKSATAAPGDEYAFFSVMASSIDFSPTFYGYDTDKRGGIPEKELAWFKKMFGVANKMRPYYLGDFYPQTEPTGLDRDVWCAYQMHRPDLDSGFVLAFRRQECPTDTLVPSLGGLKDNVTYALASWDGQPLGTLKGAELRTRPIKVAEKRGFAMFFYSPVEEKKIEVASIYYPHWHAYPKGDEWFHKGFNEWEFVKDAKKRVSAQKIPLRPLYGFLDGKNPTDVAKEIDLASNAGIDVFLFDWYWHGGEMTMQESLEQGFLRAPNRKKMKFGLIWHYDDLEDSFRDDPSAPKRALMKLPRTTEDFLANIRYSKKFFHEPNHWMRDGKPFFSIYNATQFVKDMGGAEKTRKLLDEARKIAIEDGLAGIYFQGMSPQDEPDAKTLSEAGFDCVGNYALDACPAALECEKNGTFTFDYSAMFPWHYECWKRFSSTATVPYVPVVTAGRDTTMRCRNEEPFPWRTVRYPYSYICLYNTPNKFQSLLEAAKKHVEADPKSPGAILIYGWNEYTEGGYIAPNNVDADGFLRAVASAFGRKPANEYTYVDAVTKVLYTIPAPTYENVAYGQHSKQKIDVFLPDSNVPTPVVIYIHGGSWSAGAMEDRIIGSSIRMLLNRGVAVVAVGYRFVHEAYAAGVRPPVMGCLDDCEAALRFVKDHAAEWNIDVSRLGLAGGSAGACTALYLALKDNNVHGVRALAPIIAQTSMDPQEMKEWIPNSVYGAHAFWYRDFDEWLAHRADCLPVIERISPAALARKIDPKRAPQIFLQYGAPLKPGEIAKDPTHSPAFGEHFKELCAGRGIPCKVNYGGRAFFGDAFTWLADTL